MLSKIEQYLQSIVAKEKPTQLKDTISLERVATLLVGSALESVIILLLIPFFLHIYDKYNGTDLNDPPKIVISSMFF